MVLPLAFPWLLNQTLTYWAPGSSPDGFGGVSFAAPVLVRCRWQNKHQLMRRPDGEEFSSIAIIYPAIELREKGYVALGSFLATVNPRTLTDVAFEVRQADTSPSVAGDMQMNKVFV
jgi:hypothetical protein